MSVVYQARLYEHWIQRGRVDRLRILVGCEYSDTVASAFRRLGHFAYTCDLLPSEGDDGQEWHIQGDIMDVLAAQFDWDIIILHPPCTALAVSGNRWYGKGQPQHSARIEALLWTERLWRAAKRRSSHIALENPVGVLNTRELFPRPAYVQPYQFGHKELKKTGLWLDSLPPLVPTSDLYEATMALPVKERQKCWYASPSPDRAKERSLTYSGIAAAMARQWGDHVINLRSAEL